MDALFDFKFKGKHNGYLITDCVMLNIEVVSGNPIKRLSNHKSN
jgi:hypothetical protein